MSGAAATALRYFETLRHLRPVQVTDRLARRLRSKAIDVAPAPQVRVRSGSFVAPLDHGVRLSGPDALTLINRPGRITGAAGWNDPAQPKLWLYNLHYFDWLAGTRTDDQRAWERVLIARWIAENPVGHGNGWEPYPLSLRIANWVKWLVEGNEPPVAMLDSLALQVRLLERTVEWHLLGNHLLANAKALFMAGAFFGGSEGDRWLAVGDRLLGDQWRAQILADGGHEERSAMYHAVLLEDVLDCLNVARAFSLPEAAAQREGPSLAARMLEWLAAMTHPDGSIALFNDAAPGIAAPLTDLVTYAGRLEISPPPPMSDGVVDLAASGYVRAQAGAAVLLIDAAPVGPSHQPGHAHADTLGFELSIAGTPILVSAGTSTYEIGAQRAWERSTAAHNCVVLDGRDSSDVWASFRVGRRARVIEQRVLDDAPLAVQAAHDGYRFLPGAPTVRRSWKFDSGRLLVDDVVSGADHQTAAVAWLHLAPEVEAKIVGCRAVLTWRGGGAELIASAPLASDRTTRTLGFYRTIGGISLCYPLTHGISTTELRW